MDFFRPLLGPELKSVISALKQIQDVLGDLNDADVACAMVRRALDDEPALQSHYWDINAYITMRALVRTLPPSPTNCCPAFKRSQPTGASVPAM